MKTAFRTLIAAGCLAATALLPSCVDPYASTSVGVTTYNPGYHVGHLPPGYRTEYYGGTTYYMHNGVYYRPSGGRYVVVESPRRRDLAPARVHDHRGYVTVLPRGHRVVTIRGTRYYHAGGVYYQRRGAGYVVVTP